MLWPARNTAEVGNIADGAIAPAVEHQENAPPLPEGRSKPARFDFVGGVVGIEPATAVTVVFSRPLPPARYAVFCNAEDGSTAEPHSAKRGFLELTIERSSGDGRRACLAR
jgi:hypothetical protein